MAESSSEFHNESNIKLDSSSSSSLEIEAKRLLLEKNMSKGLFLCYHISVCPSFV